MPVLATIGAASARGFGDFYTSTSISGNGWMARIGAYTKPMTSDSNNNIYVGSPAGLIMKVGPDGTLAWQKNVNQSGTNVSVERNQATGSGLVGLVGSSGSGAINNKPSIEVLDSNGNVYYSVYYNAANFINSITASDVGSIYFSGTFASGFAAYFKLYGTTIVAKKSYSNTSGQPRFVGGGSNDTAYMGDTFNGVVPSVAKVDSNLALLWRSGSSSLTRVTQVVESNGFVYAVGTTSAVVKLNATTGAFVWAKTLSSSFFTCLAVDSSDNIYAGGYDFTNKLGILLKIDNNGNLIWQRNFLLSPINAAYYTTVSAITVNNTNNSICVQVTPSGAGTATSMLFSVPNNGTPTGTYTVGGSTLVYAINSGTLSSATYTFSSLSTSLGSQTYAEVSLPVSASTASTTYDLISVP